MLGAGILSLALATQVLSQKPAQSEKPLLYNRVVCFCVGVEKYKHSTVPPVDFAEADATAIAALFSTKYFFETRTLLGEKATRKAIEQEVDQLSKELTPKDALIVFFAGHGARVTDDKEGIHGFLLPYN